MDAEVIELIREEIAGYWENLTIAQAVELFNKKRAGVYGAFVSEWNGNVPTVCVIDIITDKSIKIEIN